MNSEVEIWDLDQFSVDYREVMIWRRRKMRNPNECVYTIWLPFRIQTFVSLWGSENFIELLKLPLEILWYVIDA